MMRPSSLCLGERQNAGKPSAHEGGKGGPRSEAPWWGALGMSPYETLKGERPQPLPALPRVGPNHAGEPKAYEGGKRGNISGFGPLAREAEHITETLRFDGSCLPWYTTGKEP